MEAKIFDEHIYSIALGEISEHFQGGIYSISLPKNFNYKEPTLVLQHKMISPLYTLDDAQPQEYDYELHFVIVSKHTHTNAALSDIVEEAFNDYTDDNIKAMFLIDNNNDMDLEIGLYIKSLQYKVIFIK